MIGHWINGLGVVLIMVWDAETPKHKVIVFPSFEINITAKHLNSVWFELHPYRPNVGPWKNNT